MENTIIALSNAQVIANNKSVRSENYRTTANRFVASIVSHDNPIRFIDLMIEKLLIEREILVEKAERAELAKAKKLAKAEESVQEKAMAEIEAANHKFDIITLPAGTQVLVNGKVATIVGPSKTGKRMNVMLDGVATCYGFSKIQKMPVALAA